MGKTSIEWTDRSINPIRAKLRAAPDQRVAGHYCEKVSPGCANCYSSAMQKRFDMPSFGSGQHADKVEHFLDESKLLEVLKRRAPTKWFWADMTDLFGSWVEDSWLDRCFAVMAMTPQHTHQILTKRPERMLAYMADPKTSGRVTAAYTDALTRGLITAADANRAGDVLAERWPDRGGFVECWPPPWIWCGVSVENQATADERIPQLLQTPAAVRFLSVEPLLGPVNFMRVLIGEKLARGVPKSWSPDAFEPAPRMHWVIVGGESGHGARPMHRVGPVARAAVPGRGRRLLRQAARRAAGRGRPAGRLHGPGPAPADPDAARRPQGRGHAGVAGRPARAAVPGGGPVKIYASAGRHRKKELLTHCQKLDLAAEGGLDGQFLAALFWALQDREDRLRLFAHLKRQQRAGRGVELSPVELTATLLLIADGTDVAAETVAGWPPRQQRQARDWARAVYASASDAAGGPVPPRPEFLPPAPEVPA
jgi:protein gp37